MRRNSIPVPESGCWLWTGAWRKYGYGATKLKGTHTGAHRLAWEAFNGGISDGLFVCHKCDTRCCVNPDHLFLGTSRENNHDMIAKGRKKTFPGELNGQAKLTMEQVTMIRADSRKSPEIAREFNVSSATVRYIKAGKRWRVADNLKYSAEDL